MKLMDVGVGHIIFGATFVLFYLVISIILLIIQSKTIGALSALGFAIHFFGVWGGVEIGRYIESQRNKKKYNKSMQWTQGLWREFDVWSVLGSFD